MRKFVLDRLVCETEMYNHQKPIVHLRPFDIPTRKWDHVALDFITRLPEVDGMNTILTVVDKAMKMCHFIACTDRISAQETTRLYWQHVDRLHGIPSVLISDRDPRFIGRFWGKLWRLFATDLRMG